MWQTTKKITNNLTWFMRKGAAPTKFIGTPAEKPLSEIAHMSSASFAMCFISIAIIVTIFLFATAILFFLPPAAYSSFVTIHHDLYTILGLVVSVLIGARGLVSIANSNSSNTNTLTEGGASEQTVNMNENKNIAIDQEIRSLGSRKTHDFDDELEESPAENINITQNTI